jgi:CspA family cold shock protein
MQTGTIKALNDRGFGFIRRQNEPDLFVHASQVAGEWDDLFVGDAVTFEIGAAKDGRPCAVAVRRVP